MWNKKADKDKKRILVGASGASGMPLLIKCLELIKEEEDYESWLIMTDSAVLTFKQEARMSVEEVKKLADHNLDSEEIGAKPASGSFKTCGMLVVPCSMKTAAGIHSGYTDNLLLRAADVTIKEQRPLVLAARETPMSSIHLRNLLELSMIPGIRIIPPMLTFYHKPENIEEMVYHIAAKLLEPFGIEAKEYRRWRTAVKKISTSDFQIEAGGTKIGEDILLYVKGGEKPHIGCTVIAVPRPSLSGNGQTSATSSVLNLTGHKDESLCRTLAEMVCCASGKNVACSGGFHMDQITLQQIQEVEAAVRKLGEFLIKELI